MPPAMKGNCTRLQRYNGTTWDTISKRVSVSGPSLSRETVEEELVLDCATAGGAGTKKKAPGTKEFGDISCEIIWNPTSVTGTSQVITCVASGTVTEPGNVSVTVAAESITGLPTTLAVAVADNDTAAVWAEKVRAALSANSTLVGLFDVGGTGPFVTLTRKTGSDDMAYANDTSISLAFSAGTSTGPATTGSSVTITGVSGAVNTENHHLFASDFDNETATFWRIVHPDGLVSGVLVHATVKELGEPSYAPNETVKRTVVIEPTGEFYLASNAITSATLPGGITAPQDHWGNS